MGLGPALREARGAITQEALATAIRPKGSVDQTRISKWERGRLEPSVREIAEFERAAGKARGYVLIRAGFVAATPVEQAIIAAEELTADQRGHLLNAYAVAVQMSERDR